MLETWVQGLLADWGYVAAEARILATVIAFAGVILLSWLANVIARRGIIRLLVAIVRRTAATWDDVLLERHVFERLSLLAPSLVFYHLGPHAFPFWSGFEGLVKRAALIFMILVVVRVFDAVLNALSDIYDTLDVAKVRPIRSFVQVIKISAVVVTAVLIVALAIDRSPVAILSGFGAVSAILLLVFKDTILGLVASVQLSALDLVRKGDWIEAPQFGADGDVIDLSLTAVQVQNFDKTITVIPTYGLISGSFRNWRGMSQSGGRRIMRSILLDQQSVRFCSDDDLDRFERMALIGDYVRAKRQDVQRYNEGHGWDQTEPVNGRRLTNLGTFRAYVMAYLKQHGRLRQDMIQLVRQLAPDAHGVAIQVYCFTATTDWGEYEMIQADIFDHLLAVVPFFGLRVYQAPSGADIGRLADGSRHGLSPLAGAAAAIATGGP